MRKEYMSVSDQIELLKTRGLKFSNDRINESTAFDIIEQENYYNIINGYSSVFIQTDSTGERIEPEKYIENVEFEEIYTLYEMDKDLRTVILHSLNIFETNIKSIIARKFTEAYGVSYSYLTYGNYKNNSNDISLTLRQIAVILNTLTKYKDTGFTNPIKHYILNHGDVPMWVLVNFLTLGNISFLFDTLKDPKQNNIAKWYSDKFNSDKPSEWNNIRITSEYLSSAIKSVNYLRNVCAHGQRLFCYENNKIGTSIIFEYYKEQNGIDYPLYNNGSLFSQIILLRGFLTLEQCKLFYNKIIDIIKEAEKNIERTRMELIFKEMGFSKTWEIDLMKLIY